MATVLQTIVEKKHYKFLEEKVSWQDAIKISCESLVADGSVDDTYYEQIVACIEKYGPYIVFDNNIAMPHTTENATGVHKTGIGFMVTKDLIDFGEDEDGEKKEAKIFFTIASCDGNEHMNNIQQLMEIFMNEPLINALKEAKTPEDILQAEKDFPNEEDDF